MSGTGITRSASAGASFARLPPELAAHLVDRAAHHARVRAREVDVLEDAQGAAGALGEPHRAGRARRSDQLAGLDIAHERRAHDVQRAGLRGHHEPGRQPPDRQGTEPHRIAGGEHAALVHEDERERALELRQDLERRVVQAVAHVPREERGDEVGVGGGATAAPDALGELERVDEVPVVTERDRAPAVGLERRLGVLPRGGAGRRVAGVPDPEITVQRGEGRLR